jgi:hypothetical protein
MHSRLIFLRRLATIPELTDQTSQQSCYDKALQSYG